MMNRRELLEMHDLLSSEAKALMATKNHDYSGGKEESRPFLNFTRLEDMGVCTTEKGLLVRMTDKMSRMSTFSESGEFMVEDESLRDTVLDMINYSILLYAYTHSQRQDGKE